MAPWDILGGMLAQKAEKISTDALQWANNFLPQAEAAVSNIAGDAKKHAEQFSANAGDWVNQNLPIAAETLADILDNAKKHAEHVSIQLIWSGAPKNSQVILGNDGETVELIPITVSEWATNILPWLVETGKELAESARLEFEKAQKWALEHPTSTVFIVLGVAGLIILVAYPGLFYAPLLDALGFTSEGVAAGKETAPSLAPILSMYILTL
ncbi:hypothetical protein SMACR_01116 [Sordaria macrospora]|uniref:Uncharacterized protein n=1 Tax=Sordaria macrospora TaxID=5147 RepID=A0A8S8ZT40_SORMA|nr:hypothetical protein SMACR_01116 [Sordaria macrospora]WPJ62351.1 hypothetical protein SMAC4_01116 [Sordaria macrospora]